MLVSFDIKFIRERERERENTMLVSFDIKFIRQEQKQRRNGEACRTRPTCFWLSLIYLRSKHTNVVFYLSCIMSRFFGEKPAKQMKRRCSFVELDDVANAL